MKYLYYLGGGIILIGALMKLQHIPYSQPVLLVGLVLSAVGVFFNKNSFLNRRSF